MRVMVTTGTPSATTHLPGIIRFIGHTKFSSGIWVGVELLTAAGKNNGSVQGHSYFTCEMNYGLFVRENCVEPQPAVESSAASVASKSSPQHRHSPSKMTSDQSTVSPAAAKLSSLLKLKLSQLMEMLNQQLEVAAELEREEKQCGEPHQALDVTPRMHELRGQVSVITSKEMELLANFNKIWTSGSD